jgi:hypothetical protein
VLLGDGKRGFGAQRHAAPFAVSNLLLHDWTGDGRPDLALSGGALAVLVGNGDGTFRPPISLPSSSAVVAAADFDLDGIADLATGSVTVFPGFGDGTFGIAATFMGSSILAAGDMNGDGRPDLALIDGGIVILLNESR